MFAGTLMLSISRSVETYSNVSAGLQFLESLPVTENQVKKL
jgi:hypothetical protein